MSSFLGSLHHLRDIKAYLQQLLMNDIPILEHPFCPNIASDEYIYKMSAHEQHFCWLARLNYLYIIPFSALGGFASMYVASKFLPLPDKRMLYLFGILGVFPGAQIGGDLGRTLSAYKLIQLKDSPLASEARYKLWRMHPTSHFLKPFKNETESWRKYVNSQKQIFESFDAMRVRHKQSINHNKPMKSET